MKNLIIICMLFLGFNATAQEMNWIPSNVSNSSCELESDCTENIICYDLEYTPDATGILTSYTTGFLADCANGGLSVYANSSCKLNDNSQATDGCATFGKMLLNCSGNTGQLKVVKSQPVILHQLCFKMKTVSNVVMEADVTTGLTVSMDVTDEVFTTEKADYHTHTMRRSIVDCNDEPFVVYLDADIREDNTIDLGWNAVETTAEGMYRLERSKDGSSFEEVAAFSAREYNERTLRFTFQDTDLAEGEYMYKVTLIDSGKSNKSNVVEESILLNSGITVFPNPSTGMIKVLFNDGGSEANVSIRDAQNKVVKTQVIACGSLQEFDMTSYTPGTYMINVKGENETLTERVIIIK